MAFSRSTALILGTASLLGTACGWAQTQSEPAPGNNQPFRLSDLAPLAPRASLASREEGIALMLSVQLNTRDFGLQPALLRGKRLSMRRDTLAVLGLRNESLPSLAAQTSDPTNPWIELDAIEELQIQLNMAMQSLTLNIPFTRLQWASAQLTANGVRGQPSHASHGLLLNYDAYGFDSKGSRALSAISEWRAFMADKVLATTMLSQFSSTSQLGTSHDQFRQVRLDTTYSQSFPNQMLTFRLGDTLTSMQPWSRATRIGGIQISRNFSLQPYRITSPMPALMGTSALPSDIALYINGIKQYQGTVNAGPFTLNTPVGISGTGNAQIVLTDALGRNTTLQYSLYGSTQLLAEGLSDWSVEAGWVRKNYGYESFSYGRVPVVSGSWSRGVSNQLTVLTHAEATSGLLNIGAGAHWQAGAFGVLSAASAISRKDGEAGALVQLGHTWNNQSFFTALQGMRANHSFRDAASLYDVVRPKASGRAMLGYNDKKLGAFNIGLLYLSSYGNKTQRYATAGWSRNLGGQGAISLSVNHDLDDSRQSNVQLALSWFLDGRLNLGATASRQNQQSLLSAYASQSRPNDGGWGWSVAAQHGDGNSGQARADYLAQHFEANASIASNQGISSPSAGASGSLVLMDGHLLASRRIYDGFALVSTNGLANVPIKRENNSAGQTSEQGLLLVTQLGAYRNNRISIDPMQLPAQFKVPQPELNIVPTDRAGTLVKFDLQRIRSASIVLHDASGQPVATGSRAVVQDHSRDAATISSIVGYDGMVYFEQLAADNRITVNLPDGGQCTAHARWPDTAKSVNEIPVIGPITCR